MKSKEKILEKIKELSEDFINGKINGKDYADEVEGLIMINLETVPELEEFADFLAQYHPNKDMPELYSDDDLKKKIKNKILGQK
jgi:hypothetical protein